MHKYVVSKEVRIEGYGEKRFWVVDYSDDGKTIVRDEFGNCVKVSEELVSPAVWKGSGKTTLMLGYARFLEKGKNNTIKIIEMDEYRKLIEKDRRK